MQYKMLNNSWAQTRFRPQVQKFMHKGIISKQEYDRLMPYNMPFGYKYVKDPMSYDGKYWLTRGFFFFFFTIHIWHIDIKSTT